MRLLKAIAFSLLITLAVFLILIFPRFTQFSLTSLPDESNITFQNSDKLDKRIQNHEKLTGSFKAADNNLGILLLRTVFFSGGPKEIVFRIKEKNETNWHSENKYDGMSFFKKEFFPFGFKPFSDSKNKLFIFEIESNSVSRGPDGLGIGSAKPQAFSIYKYTGRDLKNTKILSAFLLKKLEYSIIGLQYGLLLKILILTFIISYFFTYLKSLAKNLWNHKNNPLLVLGDIGIKARMHYRSYANEFSKNRFYLLFLNTEGKKKAAVGLFIFLAAFLYRFSFSLYNPTNLFYFDLGGQGDYDQFIRASTCALNLCTRILEYNSLLKAPVLGLFYRLFGFIGGINAFSYLMLLLGSIVAVFPYVVLSKKNWFSLGGIIGSLYLATSDYFTKISLGLPSDNSSLFTFLIFYIAYFLTLEKGSIRSLIFLGFFGLVDGLNKVLFLLNNLGTFILFSPVFFREKVKFKPNARLIFSLIPLFTFVILYVVWEYIAYNYFSSSRYFLRSLIENGGSGYTTFTNASLAGEIFVRIHYYVVSFVVTIKRIIDYSGLSSFFLISIFAVLMIFAKKTKTNLISLAIFSTILVLVLSLINNNYLGISKVFTADYISYWSIWDYINIFIFSEIVFIFVLNFGFSAFRLSLPILPYIVMLIVVAKTAPFPRLWAHVVLLSIALFCFVIDWAIQNFNKYSLTKNLLLGPIFLVLFIFLYLVPKTESLTTYLIGGVANLKNDNEYLTWVNSELPKNTVILAGGKSNLVSIEKLKKPVVYNSMFGAALFIEPDKMPGINPTDFQVIQELRNKQNFKKRHYVILENDIYVWKSRLAGEEDSVFYKTGLHAKDYMLKIFKDDPKTNRKIYELIPNF